MIGGFYRRMGRIDVSMYGFWDYWKHNILIQISLAKSDDCVPVPTGTIESISLKIGFVNLELLGLF
jgi:hypothetical protein